MEEVVEGRFGGDFFAVNGDGDLSAQNDAGYEVEQQHITWV